MKKRETAIDRFRRIVNVVPWIAERGPTTVSDACDHFGISRDNLLADLDVAFMVGVPPYTPDTLIDVQIDEATDEITIGFGAYFERPLSLSPLEGQRLLIAGQAMRNSLGEESHGALDRALEKLAAALGVDGDSSLGITLGDGQRATLTLLDRAVSEQRSVDIRYYTFGSDTHADRRVDPLHLEARGGSWYLEAWCHTATERRVFRVDRIERAELLDEVFALPEADAEPERDIVGPSTIVVEVDPQRWLGLAAASVARGSADGGRERRELSVVGTAWLERLLLQLGEDAEIVGGTLAEGGDATEHWTELRRSAAARVLQRYDQD